MSVHSVSAQESDMERYFYEGYDKITVIFSPYGNIPSWNKIVQREKDSCSEWSENNNTFLGVETATLAFRNYLRELDATSDHGDQATDEEK